MQTINLVTVEEMRALERAAHAAGLAYETMMENAGRATAEAIQQRSAGKGLVILILAGPGNNGGDGLVAARYLHEWGHRVRLYLCRRAQNDDPELARLRALAIDVAQAEEDFDRSCLQEWLVSCDVLVDALLGIGFAGGLRGAIRDLLACAQGTLRMRQAAQAEPTPALRRLGALPDRKVPAPLPLIVAVDLPSGLDADTGEVDPLALKADLTVTFAHAKRGQLSFPGASWVGELQVAEIGISPDLSQALLVEVATPEAVRAILPRRPAQGHKGAFGKAMVVAGCAHYVGAPRLAAEGAYRTGAGLVTLAIPEGIYAAVAAGLTEPTFIILPDDLGAVVSEALPVLGARLNSYDALLVGPGLGQEQATAAFVEGLLDGHLGAPRAPLGFGLSERTSPAAMPLPPLVIDADGLNLLARTPERLQHLPPHCVLTPHPGEMARLLGSDTQTVNRDRIAVAQRAARAWRCVVALKGAFTVVAAPDGKVTVIPYANPALATAGTGDVLAGAIVGLMAQGVVPYEAAVCGAYLHGAAGELWRREHGVAGMLAHELLPLLPTVMQHLRTEE